MFDEVDGGTPESMEDYEEYFTWPWSSGYGTYGSYGAYGYTGYSYVASGNNSESQNLFGLSDVAYALFEGGYLAYENYEYSWALPRGATGPPWAHQSLWVFTALDVLYATFGGEDHESFEAASGWVVDAEVAFDPADVSYASFDVGAPETVEDYEEEHDQSGPSAAYAWSAALFDAGANAFEDFEGVWTDTMQWP